MNSFRLYFTSKSANYKNLDRQIFSDRKQAQCNM